MSERRCRTSLEATTGTSGGAHCCFVGQALQRVGDGYRLLQRDFGNPSITVDDLDGDGTVEIKTGDDRFAYAFSSYAGTRFPVQVFKTDGGRFVDRSTTYPSLLREEARRLWRHYHRWRGRGGDVRGTFAGWAADAVRLGGRSNVRRELDRGVRRSWLSPVSGKPGGDGFRRKLLRMLSLPTYRVHVR